MHLFGGGVSQIRAAKKGIPFKRRERNTNGRDTRGEKPWGEESSLTTRERGKRLCFVSERKGNLGRQKTRMSTKVPESTQNNRAHRSKKGVESSEGNKKQKSMSARHRRENAENLGQQTGRRQKRTREFRAKRKGSTNEKNFFANLEGEDSREKSRNPEGEREERGRCTEKEGRVKVEAPLTRGKVSAQSEKPETLKEGKRSSLQSPATKTKGRGYRERYVFSPDISRAGQTQKKERRTGCP